MFTCRLDDHSEKLDVTVGRLDDHNEKLQEIGEDVKDYGRKHKVLHNKVNYLLYNESSNSKSHRGNSTARGG